MLKAKFNTHLTQLESTPMADLFSDQDRNAAMRWQAAGLTLDGRRQRLDLKTLTALLDMAVSLGSQDKLANLFSGAVVNHTEMRPVLHPACRNPERVDDIELKTRLKQAREKTREFVKTSFAPDFLGGYPLRRIVNIGIGGSDLGPRFVYDGLKAYRRDNVEARFVSNLDPADLDDALEGADPKTTLICVVSKSFTTQETLMNADAARAWLAQVLSEEGVNARFVAATAAPDKAKAYGLAEASIFPFEDGVGGRYSFWSPAGISLELAFGSEVFDQILSGARAMDDHALDALPKDNLPLAKALIDIWNRTIRGKPARCVAAYSSRLERLASYLQQLEMESLGKSVDLQGAGLGEACSGALVWGGRGSDLQHSVFQWLHQGQDEVPVDFIAIADSQFTTDPRARALNANLAAQGAALSHGRLGEGELAAHKAIKGGRASSTIILPKLDPYSLGALIALHEHKVFYESVFYQMNAYDQFGVELGKDLARALLSGDQGPLDDIAKDLAGEIGV